jgi:VIT1/CCC1 family predicted Fe2+/Mn2+ transporter
MSVERNSLSINTDNRVVSVSNRGRHAARIPDTPERQKLEKQRSIREVVFGAQDGVLTTLGIVTGVSSATVDRGTILITGFLSMLVGALSMGVGEYLGGKAEREVVQNAIDLEQREMVDKPEEEFAEQVAYYRLKGFTDDEALTIVKRLELNPDIWLHEMVRDEFGIDLREAEGGGLRSTFAMMGSFAIGAALPVVPYAFPLLSVGYAMAGGLVLAVAALFGIGFYAGRLSRRNPGRKGLEIVLFGTVVFAISWAAGHYIPMLFGRSAVSVGGSRRSGAALALRLARERPRDHEALDLLRALVDLRDLRIAHHALDRILRAVAETAEDLHGIRRHLHRRITGLEFRERRPRREVGRALVALARGFVE